MTSDDAMRGGTGAGGPESGSSGTPAGSRRNVVIAAVAAVVVLLVVVIVAVSGGDDGDAAPTSTADGSTVPASAGATDVDASASTAAEVATTDTAAPSVPVSSAPAEGSATSSPGTTLAGVTTLPQPVPTFQPGTGETVPVETVVTAPPVDIDDEADPGTGMVFRLERLEAVDGEATGPGEIAGPAVRVTVVATNGTSEPVLLDSVVVDFVYGPDRTSASPLSGPGAERFSGRLAPGDTATGVYVFDVPVAERDEVSVLVSYEAAVSPVVFTGAAPRP